MKKSILIIAVYMFVGNAFANSWTVWVAPKVEPWNCEGDVSGNDGARAAGYTECYPVAECTQSYASCLCFKSSDIVNFEESFRYNPPSETYEPKCMASGHFNGYCGLADIPTGGGYGTLTYYSSPTSCGQYGQYECCGTDCWHGYSDTGRRDSAGWPVCEECLALCTACAGSSGYTDVAGMNYQSEKYDGTCTGETCVSTGTCSNRSTRYRCKSGYYGPIGAAVASCAQCPESDTIYTNSTQTIKARGTNVAGFNAAIGTCKLPAGTYYDASGTFTVEATGCAYTSGT
ncbi:MAG: hypothetical protein LBJ73_03850 [Rickettsiales bacterium]|nr:hypothetical protein [Rickettsiales bacterium]